MVSFTVLVGVRSFRSASKLSQMMALLLGLGASIALGTPNANLVSFSPSSGSGSEQVFVATYIVPRGVTDGRSFSLFIMRGAAPGSKAGWSSDQCILTYNVSSGVIQLAPDSGGEFLPTTATPKTAQSVSNSQCSVLASPSSATISGDRVTVRFFVAFSAAFRGSKQLYVSNDSKDRTGDTNPVTQVGTYNVTASVPAVPI
jgi:hypothetical protein